MFCSIKLYGVETEDVYCSSSFKSLDTVHFKIQMHISTILLIWLDCKQYNLIAGLCFNLLKVRSDIVFFFQWF